MHRSGTSLVAAALTEAGWSPGPHLLGPNFDNPRGFYESMEIVELHRSILRSRGYRWFNWMFAPPSARSLRPAEIAAATSIVKRRSHESSFWGWKDPRTLLFLRPLWMQVLVEPPHLLAVVRRPCCVTSSLLHRGDDIGVSDPGEHRQRLIDLWTYHTNLLLDASEDLVTSLVVVPDDMDSCLTVGHVDIEFKTGFEPLLLSHGCSSSHVPLGADALRAWSSLMRRFGRTEGAICARNASLSVEEPTRD